MKGKIFNSQEVQAIIAGNKTMFREMIKTCKQHPKSLCTKTRTAHYSIDFTENGLFWRPYGGSGLQPYPYVDGKLSNTVSLDDYCPYQVGQKIFVKEKWGIGSRPDQFGGYKGFEYEADCFGDDENLPCYEINYDKLPKNIEIDNWIGNWEQARLMPQWAARLTLEITNIKVERLGEISEDDAINEGVNKLFTEEEMKHVLRVHQIEKNDTYKNYLWHGHIGRTITKKQSDEWEYQCSAYEKAKDSFFSLWNATHKKPEEKFKANPFVWAVNFKINK